MAANSKSWQIVRTLNKEIDGLEARLSHADDMVGRGGEEACFYAEAAELLRRSPSEYCCQGRPS